MLGRNNVKTIVALYNNHTKLFHPPEPVMLSGT